jgi:hypothetical protein
MIKILMPHSGLDPEVECNPQLETLKVGDIHIES